MRLGQLAVDLDPATDPAFSKPDNVLTWGLQYDPDHHILYSLNSTNGVWRLVLD